MASTESAPIPASSGGDGGGTERKTAEPWRRARGQRTAADAAVEPVEMETPIEEQDHRDQPWQSLLGDLERESSSSPEGSDLFPCHDGFYAHSLAA